MKKVTYLLTIMFAVALMSTSCEKDDPVVPDPVEITEGDLVGDWDFYSLEFDLDENGTIEPEEITFDCDVNLDSYYLTTLSLHNMSTNKVTLDDDCTPDGRIYDYTLDGNLINCENGKRVFEIMNVETFDGTELVVKLKSATTTGLPIDGIYTLVN